MRAGRLIAALLLGLWTGAALADPAVLAAVNALRAEAGRPALAYSERLAAIADGHARDMGARSFFSHRGSDGSDLGQRARRGGYRYCFIAENIARGQPDLRAVVGAWAGSPGHRRNML
ncbi:MAG: CAP domain-containing protein, partial [Rhodobacteraceae bacterium]